MTSRPGWASTARAALCASLLLTGTSLVASSAQTTGVRPADAPPPGYLPPPLNPTGVVLETRLLSEGVYALLSNTPFADNAGFVVGADAVLVVDSGFNGTTSPRWRSWRNGRSATRCRSTTSFRRQPFPRNFGSRLRSFR